MIQGLHHITSITSSAKKTVHFYTEVLGLKLIKKTVNFDSPETYHLYFGNSTGDPGTALTFFPFKGIQDGIVGKGQVSKVQYSVPPDSLEFWQNNFDKNNVSYLLNENSMYFEDFDGLRYELVQDSNQEIQPYTKKGFSSDHAIKGFYGAVLDVDSFDSSHDVITKVLGYKVEKSENAVTNYSVSKSHGSSLTLRCTPDELSGIQGSGTVHHIAFRVEDEETQLKVREKVLKEGLHPTSVIDRKYFKSVYFREPSGILYEIATNGPGFLVDESVEDLGKNLMLPEHLEPYRKELEIVLGEI